MRCTGSASACNVMSARRERTKAQRVVKLRPNVGEEIAHRPLTARAVEFGRDHHACISAAAILRRRIDRAEADRAQQLVFEADLALVTLERCEQRAAVVEPDRAIAAPPIGAAGDLERLRGVLVEGAPSRPELGGERQYLTRVAVGSDFAQTHVTSGEALRAVRVPSRRASACRMPLQERGCAHG